MSEPYGPGTYLIQLNASGKPSFYTFDGTPVVDDPQFQTAGNASLFFQIFDSRIAFDDEPIIWHEGLSGSRMPEPPGNSHSLAENVTALILNVTHPATSQEVSTYHFMVRVKIDNMSEVLWTPDGSRVVDPTIIEKPPE